MRRETAGMSGRCVKADMVGRRIAFIRHDDRRAFVPCAEDDAECLEFADLGGLDDVGNLVTCRFPDQAGLLKSRADQLYGAGLST